MSTRVNKLDRFGIARLISYVDLMTNSGQEAVTLGRFLNASFQSYEGLVGNEVVCVWGLIPPTLLSEEAYLWLYTTTNIKEHQFVFVRHSQRIIEVMLEEFPIITGHCVASAKHSIRWVKWLGAEFGHPQGKVIPFVIRRKSLG